MKYCCHHIDDFLDDELESSELSRFHESVQQCSECQLILEENAQVQVLLKKGWGNVSVPEFGIKERAARDFDSRRSQLNWVALSEYGMLGIAVSIVIVIVGMIFVLNQGLGFAPGRGQGIAAEKKKTQAEKSSSQKHSIAKTKKNIEKPEDKKPVVNQAIAKASIEFGPEFVGVRVDDSDEDFTFYNVYETFDSTRSDLEKSELELNPNDELQFEPEDGNHEKPTIDAA